MTEPNRHDEPLPTLPPGGLYHVERLAVTVAALIDAHEHATSARHGALIDAGHTVTTSTPDAAHQLRRAAHYANLAAAILTDLRQAHDPREGAPE